MAEGGIEEDEGRSRFTRLMSPFPSRPFEAYQGPPAIEGKMLASFRVLNMSDPETQETYRQMLINHNRQIVFHVDCAYDPYSEVWITASVDILHLLNDPEGTVVNIYGPYVSMCRLSMNGEERIDYHFHRSAKIPLTAFCNDGDQIAWQNMFHYNIHSRFTNRTDAIIRLICCSAFSPEGDFLALLTAEEEFLQLSIKNRKTLVPAAEYIFVLDYIQNPATNFITLDSPCYLMWTKCGRFIVLTTELRDLIVVNIRAMMRAAECNIRFIRDDNLRNIAHSRGFDFTADHFLAKDVSALAFATDETFLRLYEFRDTGLGTMIRERNLRENHKDSNRITISCVRFSNADDFLAVGMSDGVIDLLESRTLQSICSLDPISFLTELPNREFRHNFSSFSFTCNDKFLAAGATDGMLRVWCVRQPFESLKVLCRIAVRRFCKLDDMSKLPLPKTMISYLTEIAF